jgi:hypothetical protein
MLNATTAPFLFTETEMYEPACEAIRPFESK